MTMTSSSKPLAFAHLFDFGDQQLLLEAVPSKNPEKRAVGMPDVMISTHLGWSFYEARVELSLTEKGQQEIANPHEWLVSTFTEAKARNQLDKIKSEFGGDAVVSRMLESGEFDLGDEDDVAQMADLQACQGERFANLMEVEGRQVLAIHRTDLGENEDGEGLLVKVAQPGGGVLEIPVEGLDLDDVNETHARTWVAQAVASENYRKPTLN